MKEYQWRCTVWSLIYSINNSCSYSYYAWCFYLIFSLVFQNGTGSNGLHQAVPFWGGDVCLQIHNAWCGNGCTTALSMSLFQHSGFLNHNHCDCGMQGLLQKIERYWSICQSSSHMSSSSAFIAHALSNCQIEFVPPCHKCSSWSCWLMRLCSQSCR